MKKWVIGLIVLLVVLVIFFFPKSCGGGGGTGGPWHSTECSCVGFKLVSPWNMRVMDAVFVDCYGICLKSSCENKVLLGNAEIQCQKDSDCVSQCSNGCVNVDWAMSHPDNSDCIRAWDCSCVNNLCYTDGKLSGTGE